MGHAALFAALFGYLFVANAVAGNAEPALVFFEVLALGALSFAGDEPALFPIASIAFTGAVLTKVEGTAFVAATIVAFAIARPLAGLGLIGLALVGGVCVMATRKR